MNNTKKYLVFAEYLDWNFPGFTLIIANTSVPQRKLSHQIQGVNTHVTPLTMYWGKWEQKLAHLQFFCCQSYCFEPLCVKQCIVCYQEHWWEQWWLRPLVAGYHHIQEWHPRSLFLLPRTLMRKVVAGWEWFSPKPGFTKDVWKRILSLSWSSTHLMFTDCCPTYVSLS